MSILQLRLKTCIQTILELEPQILKDGADYDKEFSFLKNYLKRVDHLDLLEDDVARLENQTSIFLAELERSSRWRKNYPILMQ